MKFHSAITLNQERNTTQFEIDMKRVRNKDFTVMV